MAYGSAGGFAPALPSKPARTPLNRQQIVGFWAAWFGWMLDGMDSVIYALVLGPALTELLPRSGIEATPRKHWIRRFPHVRPVPGGLGPLVYLGADLRQVWPHQVARRHDTGLRGVHGRCRILDRRLDAGDLPLPRGHWRGRRVAHGWHLRR